MMNNDVTADELTDTAADIGRKVQERANRRAPTRVLHVALAEFFRYQVQQGGFAQLIFNLRGEYLAEIEQMLLTAPAPVAHSYYVKAIEACLADESSYQSFLAGDYTPPNRTKDTLHGISLAYYSSKVDFLVEANPFLRRSRSVVRDWLRLA